MKVIIEGRDNVLFDAANDLRVVVAHLNSAFALRTHAVLERMGREAGGSGRLICSLWDFNSLAEPALSPMAVAETQQANLVVIATQEGAALPREVCLWIIKSLVTKPGHPRALIAILDFDLAQPETHPVVRPYLQIVARYGELSFFASDSDAKELLDLKAYRAQLARASATGDKKVVPQTPPAADWRSELPRAYATVSPAELEMSQEAN